MTDDQFREILRWFDLSWKGYRKVRKGVKRRLARHMSQLGCRSVVEYVDAVGGNPVLRSEAELLLTVSISRFFRDRGLWTDIQRHLFPQLAANHPGGIDAWSAGCACGEEPYSLALLWDEFRGDLRIVPEFVLRATDCNPQVLDRARAGIYSAGSLKEVTQDRMDAYFTGLPETGQFKISGHLKKYITWETHDFLRDEPPAGSFGIILLRNNLLTYSTGRTLSKALAGIVNSLSSGGFLVIGCHEKIPDAFDSLLPSGINKSILRKRPDTGSQEED